MLQEVAEAFPGGPGSTVTMNGEAHTPVGAVPAEAFRRLIAGYREAKRRLAVSEAAWIAADDAAKRASEEVYEEADRRLFDLEQAMLRYATDVGGRRGVLVDGMLLAPVSNGVEDVLAVVDLAEVVILT